MEYITLGAYTASEKAAILFPASCAPLLAEAMKQAIVAEAATFGDYRVKPTLKATLTYLPAGRVIEEGAV